MSSMNVEWRHYFHNRRYFRFDTETLEYEAVAGTTGYAFSYNDGAFFGDLVNVINGKQQRTRYVFYRGKDGLIKEVYGEKIRQMAYTPFLTDRWAVSNIQEINGPHRMCYAEVGEWNWESISEGIMQMPNVVGDKLTFYTDEFKGYYCDLSKRPKSLEDCILLNKDGESLRYPVIDEADAGIVYYSPVMNIGKIRKVTFDGNTPSYETVEIKGLEENSLGLSIGHVRDNLMVMSDVHGEDYDNMDGKIFFYRLDEEKSITCRPTDLQRRMEKREKHTGWDICPTKIIPLSGRTEGSPFSKPEIWSATAITTRNYARLMITPRSRTIRK